MKIGYCVEGSTDRALLEGLRQRWCPNAEMIEGRFRGAFTRREIPNACVELQHKGVDLIIMVRDANVEDWRDVVNGDEASCDTRHKHLVVFGVCERNVECWLTADAGYASSITGVPAQDFRVPDPKGIFEYAMQITSLDRKEPEIANFTKGAPLHNWLTKKSFENFYDKLRQKSKELHCQEIENLRDR
jgi:hypothetical protein